MKQLEDFLEFAERENFAFLFFFLTSGRSVSVLNLWKMAEAKVVRVLVEMSHDKLMEFMDFVDRINKRSIWIQSQFQDLFHNLQQVR